MSIDELKMSEPVTLEDIYKLFEKTNEKFEQSRQEYDRRLAEYAKETQLREIETDRRLAEIAAETQRREAEAAKEAQRREAEAAAEAQLREAEAQLRTAELERSLAELRRTSDNAMRAVEGLTTCWGRFVEELVEPAVIQLFRSRGIDVKETYSRARVKRQGIAMEIDILVVDDIEVVLVECKSRLSKDDVDEFLEKLSQFKQAFPHYKNFQAYGAVAGIEIDEGVDRYSYKKGLFVIKPSGETIKIINNSEFKPQIW